MAISFTKMQGTGNDYIYINLFKNQIENPQELAIQMSRYHYGIGSDGIVLIAPSQLADFKMIIYNADGSRAEICGNALRCVGKYVWDHKMINKKQLQIETDTKIVTLDLFLNEVQKVETVMVNMGVPEFLPQQIPCILPALEINAPFEFKNFSVLGTILSMGNPHFVIFVKNLDKTPVQEWGPIIENDPRFPKRINVEFVQLISPLEIQQRTWERGSGETLSCGSGACAACVAGILTGQTEKVITCHLKGGDLQLSWNGYSMPVMMKGEAYEVYTGLWGG